MLAIISVILRGDLLNQLKKHMETEKLAGVAVEPALKLKSDCLLQPPVSFDCEFTLIETQDDLQNLTVGSKVFVKCLVDDDHNLNLRSGSNSRVSILSGYVTLLDGVQISLVTFSRPIELKNYLLGSKGTGTHVFLHATLGVFNDLFQLKNCVVVTPIERGESLPVYIKSDLNKVTNLNRQIHMRKLVRDSLKSEDAIQLAITNLYHALNVKNPLGFSLLIGELGINNVDARALIVNMHTAKNAKTMEACSRIIQVLACYCAAQKHISKWEINRKSTALIDLNWASELLDFSFGLFDFPLTIEQKTIAKNITSDLTCGYQTKSILYGDVGYGKTAVFGSVAFSLAIMGKSVVILNPLDLLATQTFNELTLRFPQLTGKIKLVTAKSKLDVNSITDGEIYVGTSALLQHINVLSPYLVVVDEEHRFGVEQRNMYVVNGAHYLSVTATPIPRTLASAHLFDLKVHRLNNCFIKKEIVTQFFNGHEFRRTLFDEIKLTISSGAQVILVCPLIKKGKTNNSNKDAQTLHKALLSAFPDRVGILHGKEDSAANADTLNKMIEGHLDLLVSTTALEVGVNIPNARHLVIWNPERFGLAQMHQLRGRIARTGGWGKCHLFSPTQLTKDEQVSRITFFANNADGTAIADYDANARGYGDYVSSGKSQSGSVNMDSFIRGYVPPISVIKSVSDVIKNRGAK